MPEISAKSHQEYANIHAECIKFAKGRRRKGRYRLDQDDVIWIYVSTLLAKDGVDKLSTWCGFCFPHSYVVEAFNEETGLRELATRYGLSKRTFWRLLQELGLDPWTKVIADYKNENNLAPVAYRHEIRTDTLSRILKLQGINPKMGRPSATLSEQNVQIALSKARSVNELRQLLNVSWGKAKKIKIEYEQS